jgi:putative FmdB family regulatory protein
MPIYEYVPVNPEEASCEECVNGFEAIQSMTDEPYETCVACQAPVRRALSAFGVNANSTKDMLSNKNLEKNGFTKYKKAGDGVYEKTAGKGPRYIRR